MNSVIEYRFCIRLQVVSDFGDGDRGAGEICTCAREIRGDYTQGEHRASLASRLREMSLARVRVFRPPRNRRRQN